jgi:hypothetical protein
VREEKIHAATGDLKNNLNTLKICAENHFNGQKSGNLIFEFEFLCCFHKGATALTK